MQIHGTRLANYESWNRRRGLHVVSIMRMIDWNDDYSACTLVRGHFWWKRYARVERYINLAVSPFADWRFVSTCMSVSISTRADLAIARARGLDVTSSPWQRERPGAVPPMRVITEHTRVDGEVLIRHPGAMRYTDGV